MLLLTDLRKKKKEKRTIGQTIFILTMLMYSITDS